MKWLFYINNGGEHYAELTYDWDADKYECRLLDNFQERHEESPLALMMLYDQGERIINDHYCRVFIKDRVVPCTRQNIGEFLRDLEVPYYHECSMLRGMPTCVMDDARVDFVKEIRV